jgi:hypothetical protein
MGDLTFMQSAGECQGGNKWHSFFAIKPAAFQAIGAARMKLRLPGVKRLNVEHRTSNIERRIFDELVKSRIFPVFWIPAFAGMTIR